MNIDEMRAERETLRDEIIRLGELTEPTDDDVTTHTAALERYDTLDSQIMAAEDRAARAVQLREARPEPVAQAVNIADAPNLAPQHRDTYDVLNDRSAPAGEVRDAALRTVDRLSGMPASTRKPEWDRVESMVRHRPDFARHVSAFGSEEYEDAFYALLRAGEAQLAGLSTEQRNILTRAPVVVGTDASGGYLVPTHLDPTVMLTNDGTINPFRAISRVESLAGSGETWYGITSAGITASWDAELAEVSDDSPTFGNPSIPVYKGQAFAIASDEVVESVAGLPAELLRMFADARDRLEAAAFATGSGSAQPTGIFTALDANTNVEVEVTTQGSLGAVDIYAAYAAVGARWRSQSTWVMNRQLINSIRQLGSAVGHQFTVDFMADGIERLLGRPIAESSDAPTGATTTTEVNNLLAIGDFDNFVIVDKVGTRIRYSPELYGTTAARPIGAQGWRTYWRVGSDSVNDVAFTLLQDGTSA